MVVMLVCSTFESSAINLIYDIFDETRFITLTCSLFVQSKKFLQYQGLDYESRFTLDNVLKMLEPYLIFKPCLDVINY